jgi:hypothetical protein
VKMERKYTAEDVSSWEVHHFERTLTAHFKDGRKETVSLYGDRVIFPAFAEAACINQANGHADPAAHAVSDGAVILRLQAERYERMARALPPGCAAHRAATVTAQMSREGARIDLCQYAGTYGGTVDPESTKPAGFLRKIVAALTGKATP